jgi:hypothetical protein
LYTLRGAKGEVAASVDVDDGRLWMLVVASGTNVMNLHHMAVRSWGCVDDVFQLLWDWKMGIFS